MAKSKPERAASRMPVLSPAKPSHAAEAANARTTEVAAAGLCEMACGLLPPGASQACMLACGLV